MNETEEKAALDKLDKFLADNDELEQLSAELATFNVFRVLKVEDFEIRHSNMLGWLLDPAESHGLRDVFLRRILSNILLECGADIAGLSAAQVELMDFNDIEVRREWMHIDVLVIDRGNELALLIENKIGASESPGQLARYREAVAREFPTFTLVPVFLTLEGESCEDQEAGKYIAYSHARLLGVLDRIIEQRRKQMPEAVATFLDHYTNTLRRLTMQDNALVELCKKIYRKHAEAIKLIVEYGEINVFSQLADEIICRDADCEILQTGRSGLHFIPISWAQVVPENSTVWKGYFKKPVSVVCWLGFVSDEKIQLNFAVSRMDDPALRKACVKALSENGFKLKKAFREDARYSTFYSDNRPLRDSGDEEEVRNAIASVVAKAKEQFPKVEAVLKDVFPAKQ